MDRAELYDRMAERKSAPKDFGTYIGDNGRVNRCVQLMLQGKIRVGGSILDVGGGIGDLGWSVQHVKMGERPLFDHAVVLDISQKNLEAAKSKGCQTICADIDKIGIPLSPESYGGTRQFDLITALDFIEHIVDPENFAAECFRVLKQGGEVFVNTPNIQFWKHIECLMNGKFPHTSGDRDVYHGGHLAFFTYADLVEIFSSKGFTKFEQIKDEEGYSQPPESYIKRVSPRSTQEYIDVCNRFGCPNLLFKATKP